LISDFVWGTSSPPTAVCTILCARVKRERSNLLT
jgi:hypothetical protein